MVLLFTSLVAVCTEVTSNTATITLLLPILGDLVSILGLGFFAFSVILIWDH